MTRWLFILNDAPYGSERPFNALRLAVNLLRTLPPPPPPASPGPARAATRSRPS